MKRIVEAHIIPMKDMFTMPKVMIVLKGETKPKLLFEYYPDEISFTAHEFIGLTETEARHLKFEKDKRYLQS
jgi:hypothetical protein